MITANWHNKNTITAAAKATALVAKYMLLSSTQQIQHPDSYVAACTWEQASSGDFIPTA